MIKKIIYTITTLFLSLFILIVFLFATQTGLHISILIAQKVTPGQLTIKKASGRLIRNFHIEELDYHTEDTDINIHDLLINWRPIALLEKKIDIKKLSWDKAIIDLPARKSEQKTKPSPSLASFKQSLSQLKLPIDFSIDSLFLHNTTFKQNKKTIDQIQLIQFKGASNDQLITIEKAEFKDHLYHANIKGAIHLTPLSKVNLSANFSLIHPGYHPVEFQGQLKGNLNQTLSLKIECKNPFTLSFDAKVDRLFENGQINLNAHWKKLILPIDEHHTLMSPKGMIDIHGKLDNYQIFFNTDLHTSTIPAATYQLKGTGSLSHIDLSQITIHTLDGIISGNAILQFSPFFSWETALSAKSINPGIYWPDWQAELNTKITSEGSFKNKYPKITLTVDHLNGQLRDQKIKGFIDATLKDNALLIKQSQLKVGDNLIRANGALNQNWDFHFYADVPDIRFLIPSYTGVLKSEVNITGKQKHPVIKGNLTFKNVFTPKLEIKSLDLISDFSFDSKTHSTITLNAENILFKNHLVKKIHTQFSGALSKHQITLNIETHREKTAAKLKASYQNKTWKGTLDQLNLTSKIYHNWHLKNKVNFSFTKNNIAIMPFNWLSRKAHLSGKIDIAKTKQRILLNAEHFPTAFFDCWITRKVQTHALMNLNLDATLSQQKLKGYLSLQLPKTILEWNRPINPPFELGDFVLTGKSDSKGIALKAELHYKKRSLLNAKLKLPSTLISHYKTAKLTGNLKINMPYLTFLPILIPQVNNTDGKLNANLVLKGTLTHPIFQGTLALADAKAYIQPLSIFLKSINFLLKADSPSISLKGEITSQKGKINLDGTLNTTTFPPSGVIKIRGKNFLSFNSNGIKIITSPDMEINYQKPTLWIKGLVKIPKALVAPKDFTSTETLPSNIVYTDQNNTLSQSLFNPHIDLTLTLGNDIHLKFAGLEANLTGKLTIFSRPLSLTTGEGELKIAEGKYQAYGEKLYIDHGHLIFAGGAINNPGINLRASKKVTYAMSPSNFQSNDPNTPVTATSTVKKVKVGIDVHGTVKNPKITLFSEPSGLTNSNILSLLVLGVPANSATNAQAQLLLKAANAMGFGGSNLPDEIQKTFGLSEFGFQSSGVLDTTDNTTKENTSFVVGKYITPKLYLSYSLGLLIPINILHVRYLISKRLALQTETSTQENGADLFYTFETG